MDEIAKLWEFACYQLVQDAMIVSHVKCNWMCQHIIFYSTTKPPAKRVQLATLNIPNFISVLQCPYGALSTKVQHERRSGKEEDDFLMKRRPQQGVIKQKMGERSTTVFVILLCGACSGEHIRATLLFLRIVQCSIQSLQEKDVSDWCSLPSQWRQRLQTLQMCALAAMLTLHVMTSLITLEKFVTASMAL